MLQHVEAITFVKDTVKKKINSLTWNEALLLTSKKYKDKILADFGVAEKRNAALVAQDWSASNRSQGIRDRVVPRNG